MASQSSLCKNTLTEILVKHPFWADAGLIKTASWTNFMDEAALHELLSGQRHDVAARLLRSALYGPSLAYSAVMRLRNLAYDRGWLRIERVGVPPSLSTGEIPLSNPSEAYEAYEPTIPVPVISLGNLTTGGTGKTPLAAYLTNWLIREGCRPGLLSRGYRSLPVQDGTGITGGNDEKRVLDQLCPGVPHLQQRDRVCSARRAVVEYGCDILILDDGFQHRRLHRDLDLVLIDALRPWVRTSLAARFTT